MNREDILKRVKSKNDFSKILDKDVLLAYSKFEKRQCSDDEKIRLTRDLLRKVYSAFVSNKLLSLKDKDEKWFLRKHLSTRERLNFYEELYKNLIKNFKEVSIIDLGAGINGFSYKLFPNKVKIDYTAVEGVGQLTDLMNFYFEKNKLNARAIHESLFNLENIKEIIKNTKKPRIIFIFKVIDSLEMLEPNYCKTFLEEIVPLCDKVIISFATRSMIKKDKFRANRKWIIDFIIENFELISDFELGNERYVELKGKFKFK